MRDLDEGLLEAHEPELATRLELLWPNEPPSPVPMLATTTPAELECAEMLELLRANLQVECQALHWEPSRWLSALPNPHSSRITTTS